jgi:hypothetical protein
MKPRREKRSRPILPLLPGKAVPVGLSKRHTEGYAETMRMLPLLAAALLAACGSETPAGPAPSTSLVVTVDRDGPHGSQPAKTVRLRCPGAGCGLTKKLTVKDFAPPRPDVACNMIYSGPQTATVRGLLRGKPVNARFSRTDGCQTNRWERVKALLRAA